MRVDGKGGYKGDATRVLQNDAQRKDKRQQSEALTREILGEYKEKNPHEDDQALGRVAQKDCGISLLRDIKIQLNDVLNKLFSIEISSALRGKVG